MLIKPIRDSSRDAVISTVSQHIFLCYKESLNYLIRFAFTLKSLFLRNLFVNWNIIANNSYIELNNSSIIEEYS